ncbi:hypothetical protein B9T07_23965 [Limnospira fusiformis CCALA 023]
MVFKLRIGDRPKKLGLMGRRGEGRNPVSEISVGARNRVSELDLGEEAKVMVETRFLRYRLNFINPAQNLVI